MNRTPNKQESGNSIVKNKKKTVLNSLKFNDLLRKQEIDKQGLHIYQEVQEQDDNFIENEKLMVKVFNCDKIYDVLNEFILNENRSMDEPDNFNRTRYVSHESHQEFFEKYKSFTEKRRKGLVNTKTPSLAFIKAANDQMLVPNPLGLIKRNGKQNQFNLKNFKVGDDYMKALSKGLQYSDHINELNLSSNRLTFNGVKSLISSVKENKKMVKRLKVMDLSYNKIGGESINQIISYIQQEECELKELNLEGNSLGDEIIINLCENVIKYLPDKIYLLNFGKNLISDKSAVALANVVQNCHNLQVFILCWNHLKNLGASLIINKLRKHYQMKVFDISWNSIGNNLNPEPTVDEIQKVSKPGRAFYNYEVNEFRRTMNLAFKKYAIIPPSTDRHKQGGARGSIKPGGSRGSIKPGTNIKNTSQKNLRRVSIFSEPNYQPKNISAFAKELGDYFRETVIDLVHLDISHNNISYDDSFHLSICIKSNHTILGLHVDGNEMMTDGLGFIHPIKKLSKDEDYYANSQIYYGIGKENNLRTSHIDKIRKIRAKNNCWICEGWAERDIKFYPSFPIPNPSAVHVKLHLNFEDWKPFDTIYANGCFFNSRMCPPGEVQYFFSCDKQIIDNYGDNTTALKEEVTFEFNDEYNKEFNNLQLMNTYSKTEPDDDNSFLDDPAAQKKQQEGYSKRRDNVFSIKQVGSFQVDINKNVVDDYYRKNLKYCEPRPERSFNKFVKPRTPWSYPISIWAYYDYKYEGDSEEYLDEAFEFDFARCYGKEKEELKPILRPHYRKIVDCYKVLSTQMASAVWQITQNALTEFVNSCPGLLDNYLINDVLLIERGVKANDKMEKNKLKLRTLPDNLIRHQFLNFLVKIAGDKYVRNKIYDLPEAVTFSIKNHYLAVPYEHHSWRKERYYNELVDNFYKAHIPILDAVFKSNCIKEPGIKDVWMILENFNDLMLRLVDTESFPVRELPMYFNISMKLQIDEISTERIFKMQFSEFLEGLSRVVDKAFPVNSADKTVEPLINKLELILPFLIKSITNPEYKSVREKFPLPTKEQGTGLYEYDFENPFYQGLEIIVKKK